MPPPGDDRTRPAREGVPDTEGMTDMDISVRGLSKRFGRVHAVRDVTFGVPAGQVTGFLGPNGAGKTPTLRMRPGLVAPPAGGALIGGRRYADLPRPRHTVGAVLEATGFHPGRRGRDHLRILAQASGAAPGRVDEVLDQVDLAADAGRRVGGDLAVIAHPPRGAPAAARASPTLPPPPAGNRLRP